MSTVSGKRLVIYLLLLGGLGALVWLLVRDGASERRSGRRPAPRQAQRRPGHGRSLQLPALPGGEDPELLTMVQGQVRDGDSNKPVAEVHLRFQGRGASASGVTDGTGTYRVELPGGTYRVSLRASTHVAPDDGLRIQVERGSPVRWLDFTVYRMASVAGRVVDAGGKPVSATVRVERARGPRHFASEGMSENTDGQGRFTLRVPPGEVVLRADAGSLGAALSPPLYTRPGAHLEGITIRVGQGLSLNGKVVGPGNQRISGGQVLLRDELGVRRLPCDADGNFAAGGLTPGAKLLQAMARDFSPSQVTQIQIQPGPPVHLVLQVMMPKGVGGQVLDEQGQPLGGITVTVRPGGPSSRVANLQQPQKQVTTADGRFMFTQVPNAPLVITARGPGNTIASRAGVAPGTYDNELRLQGTGTIVGQVTEGAQGKPVRDFTVAVTGAQGTGNPFGPLPRLRVASPSGDYSLENLVAGTYNLTFTAPGYGATEKVRVAVMAGSTTQANAVLDAAGKVSGVAVDPRGVGIPGVAVRLDTGWLGAPAVTDAEGRFELRDVSRGRRSLSATHPDYDTRIVSSISVFPGQTAEVRVELSPRKGKRPGLRFSGIGVVITNRAGRLVVVKTLDGSPAELAGLKAGDVLRTIDGRSLGFQEAIEAIRGLVGTPIRLKVQRGEREFEVDVIRDEVTVQD